MTVSSTTTRADYNGNGVTTLFAVPFYFLDSTHLKVISTVIATGISTTLTLGTDYSVAGAGVSAGGSITCTSAPATTVKISILRNVPYTQLTHYVENDPFPAASHEEALDQLTMEVQQLGELNNRSIKLPASTSTPISTELPTPESNTVIGWDSNGTNLVNLDPADFSAVVTYANWVYDTYTGDGVTTSFTLQRNPVNIANMDVSIDGVTQLPITDYIISGLTITFISAPPNGSAVFARYGQAATQTTSSFTVYTATATAGQTVFTLGTTYNPGSNNIAVYVNGLLMTPGVDYTETNSATVTFTKGLTAGDEVLFQCGRTLNDGYDSANVSFLQSGTNAVARTVQSKLRDVKSDGDYATFTDYINAAVTSNFLTEYGATVQRFNDRVFIGDASKHKGDNTAAQADWLTTFQRSTGRGWGWIQSAQSAVLQGSNQMASNAFVVGAQTANLYDNYSAIGIIGVAVSNKATGTGMAWGGYFEAYRASAASCGAYGIELDTVNYGSLVQIHPFYQSSYQVVGLQLAAGAELPTTGQFSSAAAINIQYNHSTFDKGIVFGATSLSGCDGVTGAAFAIAMAKGHTIAWWSAANTATAAIRCDNTTAAGSIWQIFQENNIYFNSKSNNQACFEIASTPNQANHPAVKSSLTGNPVQFLAYGLDTDVDLHLVPQGAGVVRFGTYTAGTFSQTGYITVRDSGGTVRRLMVG